MEVFDQVIHQTRDLLKDVQQVELPVEQGHTWNLLKENEFLMRKDVAFELGKRELPSTCFNCITSNKDLVGQDKIVRIGKDLDQLQESTTFSRITFLNVDDIKDPDKAYQNVKRLDFARYRFIPEGYMILSSSVERKEQVRVSKEAISKGLNFTTLGNLLIDYYKENYGVNAVQVYFITEELDCIQDLIHQADQVEEITNAFDHILKNIILDCDACPLHPICDDVDALRKIHFNLKQEEK